MHLTQKELKAIREPAKEVFKNCNVYLLVQEQTPTKGEEI